MPKNELLDMLFDCFREYKHWGLKNLRGRLKQPEAYLRETLEGIADLIRQGTYANTWRLKKDLAANIGGHAQESQAPTIATYDGASDAAEGFGTDEDNADGNVRMEDVQLH